MSTKQRRRYNDVIPIITDNSDFVGSDQYRKIVGIADDLPGVVAAAYAKYLGAHRHSRLNNRIELMRPFNEFAGWHDVEVDNMLRDEVFEQMAADESLVEFKSAMNSDLLNLLHHWFRDNEY
jgi:hypothetical protein